MSGESTPAWTVLASRAYIWQHPQWPHWRYDLAQLAAPLARVSQAQGHLLGRLADVGLGLRDRACLTALTEDVLKTSEIEGELLDLETVRSSLARRLGVDVGALLPVDHHVEGVVDMVLDATGKAQAPLSLERLCGWHAALFPTGRSGLQKIAVGVLRSDADGPMRVVSGPDYRETVHFVAPPAARLAAEMAEFMAWAEDVTDATPALIKAGLAHLWFVTLHPFDDGNGRIARAIGDLMLARADGSSQRFYSLSGQIQRSRKDYYEVLERTQKGGTLDVTPWLCWFLQELGEAVASAGATLDRVLTKARFWQHWSGVAFNQRQLKVLNRLLDGFDGHLSNKKWAALCKCSADTALRDITQLLAQQVLIKGEGAGRSSHYVLAALVEPARQP
ncbi:Fic family protein [Paucibacter sp. XJ19-41]|uniref:Fic family protein n=1 Tax=Paucibacter sp. XJ19-41 TaxID=2927824 RepID=UPI0023498A41|nr:Fic family protein [Paucibacter sp. XJ19-41]MDC6166826.1 Fic family protein [Paucibacter sp. XJ19-41]